MKLIVVLFSMLWIPLSNLSEKPITESTSPYVEDFEKGFRYVMDNQQMFVNMNSDQFVQHVQQHFNVSTSIRIRTLDEILKDGKVTWSTDVNRILSDLNQAINSSETFADFLKKLVVLENEANRLTPVERDKVKQFLADLKLILILFDESLQYYGNCCDFDDLASWWERFGKCVTGILGGVGTGALGGAAIGAIATVGIGVLPGAVVGGIAGGLTAASNLC